MNTDKVVKAYEIVSADNAADLINDPNSNWQPWGQPFRAGTMSIEGMTYKDPTMQAIVQYESEHQDSIPGNEPSTVRGSIDE